LLSGGAPFGRLAHLQDPRRFRPGGSTPYCVDGLRLSEAPAGGLDFFSPSPSSEVDADAILGVVGPVYVDGICNHRKRVIRGSWSRATCGQGSAEALGGHGIETSSKNVRDGPEDLHAEPGLQEDRAHLGRGFQPAEAGLDDALKSSGSPEPFRGYPAPTSRSVSGPPVLLPALNSSAQMFAPNACFGRRNDTFFMDYKVHGAFVI